MVNSTVYQSKWKPIVEPRRAKPKTYRQAPTHWLKFYEEAVIGSESKSLFYNLRFPLTHRVGMTLIMSTAPSNCCLLIFFIQHAMR